MWTNLCKGGCGTSATYRNWCKIKWTSGKRFAVSCPKVEEKRGESISVYRIKEAQAGENPMQYSDICRKNHSAIRNQRASKALKLLGEKGLLPQQIETFELKEKRRKNVAIALREMWLNGIHPRQLETVAQRRNRLDKMANTLKRLGVEGRLPVQNYSPERKKEIGKKIADKIIEGIRSGRIKLSPSWKRIKYKDMILRSKWEQIIAEFLDKNSFRWEYETLKIDYYDSVRKKQAITIPDFYLPLQKMIIEVKSNAEYNSQKTKDKAEAIRQKGFKYILAGRKEIEIIKNNETEFLYQLKNMLYEKS